MKQKRKINTVRVGVADKSERERVRDGMTKGGGGGELQRGDLACASKLVCFGIELGQGRKEGVICCTEMPNPKILVFLSR
jgi:hypothetical protein